MKILIIGSGGREHALTWKLSESPMVRKIIVAPGNAGTSSLAENVNIDINNTDSILSLAKSRAVQLVVIGPEAPLVAGVSDLLRDEGIPVFGPSKSAARIEGSKSWAKMLMDKYGIPTAKANFFKKSAEAINYLEGLTDGSYVIKFDGLAAGKGVLLPETLDEASKTVTYFLEGKAFGEGEKKILIEDRMTGPEMSVFAFVHGEYVSKEMAVCDYKRANDGDIGPNTGGMGGYSPPEFWSKELQEKVRTTILEPTAKAMVREGSMYSGVLFAGLMITDEGPKVIEFNCRFGDPECELLMTGMETDIFSTLWGIANGQPDTIDLDWGDSSNVAVVMVSEGYPVKYKTGLPIDGLGKKLKNVKVFHAGTVERTDGKILTSGGRVLVVVGTGHDLADARSATYAGVDRIGYSNAHFRSDICLRALKN